MKIVMIGESASHREELAAALEQEAEFVALPVAASDDPAFDAEIDGADVLVSMRFQRPSGQGPKVDLLHVPGAGLDRIDFAGLHADTVVCNAFEHEIPIAEYVTLSMLQHEIRMDELQASFSTETWSHVYRARIPHGELYGKTMGVIGFGRIGQCIASRAKAFGMNVIGVDNRAAPGKDPYPATKLLHPSQQDELYAQVDYLVIACPLNDATRGMIDTKALAAMKKTAVLINVSRAPLVDEDALYDALKNYQIAAAYLDVWYSYPVGATDVVPPSRHRFEDLPNAICTPHCSAWTKGLFVRRYASIAHNINRLTRGAVLQNVVHGDAEALLKRYSADDQAEHCAEGAK